MATSIRPEAFDRAGAKAAGYTDEEIDQYLMQSVGPRRSLVSAPEPSRPAPQPPVERAPRADAVVPLADGFLGGLGSTIAAGAGTAVRKLLQGDDRPLGEVFRQLKGDVDSRGAAFARDNPKTSMGLTIGGGIGGAILTPAGRAINTILPAGTGSVGARATNNAIQGALGGGVASAADTNSDDPLLVRAGRGVLFGAVGGAGLGGLMEGGGKLGGKLLAGMKSAEPELPQLGPRAPVRRTVTKRGATGAPATNVAAIADADVLAQVRKRPNMGEVFDSPNPNPAPVANGPMPDGFAMRELGPQLDPAGSDGLNRVAQRYGLFNDEAMQSLQRRPVADRIFDQPNPNPAPAAVGEFPDGYAMRDIGPKLEPAGSEGLNRAVARSGLIEPDALEVLTRRGQPDPFVGPRADPAPASRRSFPEGFTTGTADDVRFQLEGASAAEAALLPKLTTAREAARKAQEALDRAPLITKGPNAGAKPAGLVRVAEQRQAALRELEAQLESARGAAKTQRDELARLGAESPAVAPTTRPQPAASAAPPVREAAPAPTPLAPRASAAPSTIIEPPIIGNNPAQNAQLPAQNVRSTLDIPPTAPAPTRGLTPNAGTDAAGAAVSRQGATIGQDAAMPNTTATGATTGAVDPPARPALPPSERGEVNWRTWLDTDAPGAKSVEARLREAAAPEQVKAARGYESMNATYARATALAKELVDDNGLQTIDAKKVRALVDQHGEAAIPALRKVAVDNAKVMADAARVLNDPLASADDVLRATQVLDSATRQTDELLGSIVNEQARAGRSLNALKIQAKLSSDPDLWMVHAKRALGDQPMTDDIMAQVRRLAREASEACG
jgi:hypothetical protein